MIDYLLPCLAAFGLTYGLLYLISMGNTQGSAGQGEKKNSSRIQVRNLFKN